MTTQNSNNRTSRDPHQRDELSEHKERGRWPRSVTSNEASAAIGRVGASPKSRDERSVDDRTDGHWIDRPYRSERVREMPETAAALRREARPEPRPIGAARPGSHRGKGPSGYQRSDSRLRELVCEALAEDDEVDATQIEVTVSNGIVTLSGSVPDRPTKRMAEDVADRVWGVRDVQNQLEIVVGYRGNRTGGPEL